MLCTKMQLHVLTYINNIISIDSHYIPTGVSCETRKFGNGSTIISISWDFTQTSLNDVLQFVISCNCSISGYHKGKVVHTLFMDSAL